LFDTNLTKLYKLSAEIRLVDDELELDGITELSATYSRRAEPEADRGVGMMK
jgi:hypothetical protein